MGVSQHVYPYGGNIMEKKFAFEFEGTVHENYFFEQYRTEDTSKIFEAIEAQKKCQRQYVNDKKQEEFEERMNDAYNQFLKIVKLIEEFVNQELVTTTPLKRVFFYNSEEELYQETVVALEEIGCELYGDNIIFKCEF